MDRLLTHSGEGWFSWYLSPEICGIALWGTLDARAVDEALAQSGHEIARVNVVDVRGLVSVTPAAVLRFRHGYRPSGEPWQVTPRLFVF